MFVKRDDIQIEMPVPGGNIAVPVLAAAAPAQAVRKSNAGQLRAGLQKIRFRRKADAFRSARMNRCASPPSVPQRGRVDDVAAIPGITREDRFAGQAALRVMTRPFFDRRDQESIILDRAEVCKGRSGHDES